MTEGKKRYFIAKCATIDALRTCRETNVWACSDRKTGPQPRDILGTAFNDGAVVLIYSVNNCHGWHGYAAMESLPGSLHSLEGNVTGSDKTMDSDHVERGRPLEETTNWHRFRVTWHQLYLDGHGEQCLPFSATASLLLADGQPVNQARNFQEAPLAVGEEMCQLIDQHIQGLNEVKQKKQEAKLLKAPAPFFQPSVESDPSVVWHKLVKKVEKLGQVHLACAFGSQRYNLHTPSSDTDMFVVYQASTATLLTFDPPQQTIKNRDTETCDYTVHEIYRYCELLLAGDPRCVETLFLHPSSIYYQSDEFKLLCSQRSHFMTRACADKYLADACGAKGLRLLDKWTTSGDAMAVPMPGKVCKLFYIIVRLLQNANDVCTKQELQVYRPDHSENRKLLMDIRQGLYTYQMLRDKITELLAAIESNKTGLPKVQDTQVRNVLEKWVLGQRYRSLQDHMQHTDMA